MSKPALLAKFERQVDPEGVLPPEERHGRAEHARKAHLARISLRSAKGRRLRAELARMKSEIVAESAGAEDA